jgi:hypothetical protein
MTLLVSACQRAKASVNPDLPRVPVTIETPAAASLGRQRLGELVEDPVRRKGQMGGTSRIGSALNGGAQG